MKKQLIISIQLALGTLAPACAAAELSNVTMTAGQFTYGGSMTLSNSTLTLTDPVDKPFGTLLVNGNLASNATTMHLFTVLDAGGASEAGVGTHRVLVNGDMQGSMLLSVNNLGGAGASTDSNGNAFNDPEEGISIAQVSGASNATAFQLDGEYVAVGPFQYRLSAYAPGTSDAGQRLVNTDADGHWDYRLQTAKVRTGGTTPVAPIVPPSNPVVPGPGPDTRAALVPQAPSYLVHNNAVFSQGLQVIGALHQRLGEIHGDHAREGSDVYARAIGSGHRYISDLTVAQYGYDYEQVVQGLQLGGNWLGLDAEASQLRVGLALSSTWGRTDPRVMYSVENEALEISREKTRADSLAATLTWTHDSGFYVDTVLGASQYDSDISTPLRKGRVARLESNDVFASVEAGFGWTISDGITLQPEAQITWQKLDTDRVTDADGVVVDMGTPEQLTWRLGARALFTPKIGPDGSVLTQYVKLNYFDSEGPDQRALLSGQRIATGRYGHTAEFGFGLTASLKNHLSFYGDATWQQDIGHASREGWSATLGVRWAF